jgi:hypothetical protein
LDSRAALVVTASPLPNPYFNSLVIASAALSATTQSGNDILEPKNSKVIDALWKTWFDEMPPANRSGPESFPDSKFERL